MRTSVVLKDDLVREAMQYTSVRSKRGLIEEALQTFVAVKARYRIAWPV
jgi:Arc/MetJ family transcription regulator